MNNTTSFLKQPWEGSNTENKFPYGDNKAFPNFLFTTLSLGFFSFAGHVGIELQFSYKHIEKKLIEMLQRYNES